MGKTFKYDRDESPSYYKFKKYKKRLKEKFNVYKTQND